MSLRRSRTPLHPAIFPTTAVNAPKVTLKAAHKSGSKSKCYHRHCRVAGLILSWAQVKKVQTVQAAGHPTGARYEVTVLDTVYRAHPVTGELIVAGVDAAAQNLANYKANELITHLKNAKKAGNSTHQ
jgi:hypothetical protein